MNNKSNFSGKMNQLEVRIAAVQDFVASMSWEFLLPENSNFVIIASTLIITGVISIILQWLKSLKRVKNLRAKRSRCLIFEEPEKVANNSAIGSESIHKTRLERDKTTNHLKYLSEFYSAADTCFIEKYAKRCRELVEFSPHLINIKFENSGQTPFHRVCFHGHASLIKLMLAKGADPHLFSDAGESPICLAIYSYLNEKNNKNFEAIHCLDILQQAGCDKLGSQLWYDILVKMSMSAGNQALTRWLLINGQYK